MNERLLPASLSPADPIVPCNTPLLTQWQQLTRAGVQASRSHQPMQATALHQQALAIAQQLFAADADAGADDDRVAAFVVSHLNLADAYLATDQRGAAAECLCSAHEELLATLQDETLRPSLRIAAGHHRRETHAALSQHLAAHGPQLLVSQTLASPITPAQLH